MKDNGSLTDVDHQNMDAFLRSTLDDYKNGIISRSTAVNILGHVIAAIDIGNHSEARHWFQNPNLIRDSEKNI